MTSAQQPPLPPPPPPPPPAPPGEVPRKKTPPLAHFGAVALLVVAVLPEFFIGDPDGEIYTVSYRIGRMIGAALFGLLVAALIWWIVRRTRPPEARPAWSPWVFLIAAGAAFFMGFMNIVQRDVTEAAQESAPPYEAPADGYFIEPPGFTYKEMAPQVEEVMAEEIASEPGAEEEIADYAAREVLEDGQPAGLVLVMMIEGPPDLWTEFHAGVIRGFEESSGTELRDMTIAGYDGAEGSIPQGEVVIIFDRNLVIAAVTDTKDAARAIADAQTQAFD